jgi:hypothetical protein
MSPENMETPKAYIEHLGKVIETNEQFKLVMAITLDPRTNYHEGILRCITSRSGEIGLHGNLDRSELRAVSGNSLEHFQIGERLKIKNEDEVIASLGGDKGDFIGLEDPDIWIDEKTDLMHVYFTIPILVPTDDHILVSLGHAVGKDIHSLEMTEPALTAHHRDESAKEVSIAPINKQGVRLNLFESHDRRDGVSYSTVRVATVHDMGKPWQYGETVFHPTEHDIPWIAGHASPGPLFSKDFIDVGEGKLVGVMNGREANKQVGEKTKYRIFSVGLFIYDYENGKIDWVSPEPLIRDSEAKTITFASQFVEQGNGSGVLYAHVDDSFVRAYTINAEEIKKLLP